MWIVEILRALAAESLLKPTAGTAEVNRSALPDTVRQLVLRRLRVPPDATLAVLRTAAVLGNEFSVIDLATVTGVRALDLLTDLAPALAAACCTRTVPVLAFRHQLVHAAIHEAIPESVRAVLHRDTAHVLADAGAPLAQVAVHLLHAAVPGDRQSADLLRAGARDALPRAPDLAVQLLRRVEELADERGPDPDAVTAELVDALLRAGRVADAADRAEAVRSRPHDQALDARLRVALVTAVPRFRARGAGRGRAA